jgi:hypothetical protein
MRKTNYLQIVTFVQRAAGPYRWANKRARTSESLSTSWARARNDQVAFKSKMGNRPSEATPSGRTTTTSSLAGRAYLAACDLVLGSSAGLTYVMANGP